MTQAFMLVPRNMASECWRATKYDEACIVFGSDETEARRSAALAFAIGSILGSPWLDPELVACRRTAILGDKLAPQSRCVVFLADRPTPWERPLRAA